MQRIEFGRWVLDVDVTATQEAYKNTAASFSDSCADEGGCLTCRNYIAQRNQTFTGEVQDFMDRAGISTDREAELCYVDRCENGLYLYQGWFHFVGQIVSGTDAHVPNGHQCWYLDLMNFAGNLSVGISVRSDLVDPAFSGEAVLQLDFETEIPWVIGSPQM